MTQEQFRTRVQSAEREVFIVTQAENGWRVRSPRNPSQFYLVSPTDTGLTCSCPDFQSHAAEDPGWTCKHMLAVQGREAKPSPASAAPAGTYADEERAAIQAEGAPRTANVETEKPESEKLPAQMVIKRSVSPDGRIDSVSVEFTTWVTGMTGQLVKNQAQRILKLQNEIVSGFLKSNRPARPSVPQKTNGAAPARLIDVGSMNGQYGERYYLNVEVNGRRSRFFGTLNQIADAIAMAGRELIAEEIEPGMLLNLPCKALTERSADGRYVNVTRVLPVNGEARVRR
jgi:SWIM zinc finger